MILSGLRLSDFLVKLPSSPRAKFSCATFFGGEADRGVRERESGARGIGEVDLEPAKDRDFSISEVGRLAPSSEMSFFPDGEVDKPTVASLVSTPTSTGLLALDIGALADPFCDPATDVHNSEPSGSPAPLERTAVNG